MQHTYHIRVKKDYAAAVIEDLQKMDAVELMPAGTDTDVPHWQQEEVRRRIEKYKNDPGQMIDEAAFFKMLEE